MTLFGIQVACSCGWGAPIGMEQTSRWDGDDSASGFVAGRRYVWVCPECGHMICVNMKEMDEDEQ